MKAYVTICMMPSVSSADLVEHQVSIKPPPFPLEIDRDASRPYDRRTSLAPIDAPMPFGAARVAMVKRMILEMGA